MSELNASAVKKMKVNDLRSELTKRGLDTKGLKQVLVDRLLAALVDDQSVEMGTEVKEQSEEVSEEAPAADTNGKEEALESSASIAAIPEQPPAELMVDDSAAVSSEQNDEIAANDDEVGQSGEEVNDEKVDEPMEGDKAEEEPAAVENETQNELQKVDDTAMENDEPMKENDESLANDEKIEDKAEVEHEEEEMNEQEEKNEKDLQDKDKKELKEKDGDELKEEDEEVKEENEEELKEEVEKEDEEKSGNEHERKDEKESHPLMEVDEEKDDTEDSSVVLSRYISDIFFKISPDGLTGSVITDDGFTYIWAGAKTTWGVNKGKVCYECKILKNFDTDLPESEEPRNGVRVGWSATEASLQLGEEGLSYGYENTGKSCTSSKFSEYGVKYTQGDVIGCYLDMEGEEWTISYTKNGEELGTAFTLSKEDLDGKVLFPHIILKNTECQINAGDQEEPWFPCKEGFTLIEKVGNENLVEGLRSPKERGDCEVVMMVGLPASGKTTWVNKHVIEEKDKNYNIIGTNSVMAKMKINGEDRKRSADNYDKLMEKATKCLRRIFEIAPTKRRNYILDQTNVHPNAQKRKMESFKGFKRIAVIVCPKPEELERRTKEKKDKKGFEVPEFALNDMKANFSLPRVGPLFSEVKFIEEDEEEAEKIVAEYKRNAKGSSHSRGNSYRRYEDHRSSGRYHPYRRDDNRSRRGGGSGGGGGKRDFRQFGGRGGSSSYGRQHGGGGSSHDRRSGGGHNKGYQSYSRGGNRSGSGNRGGNTGSNYHKNYQQQQQQQSYQQQQQRYATYGTAQYSFPQQPAYPGFQSPYQARPAYPTAATAAFPPQQQPAYYYPQQGYYQHPGYGQPASYGQYPRRY